MRNMIVRRDYSLMHLANNWDAPRWIQWYALGSTRGGDGWLWFVIGLAILLFGDTERFAAVAGASLAGVLSVTAFIWLKRFTGRKRPCFIEPHCWATLLPPDQFSFPSGHTMTAFAVCVSLSLFYPALSVGLFFCALSVAISRILLGMHFLSDVLAGALIGTALGYMGFLAFR
jgi:undecaprenyl-diphosphatase